MQHNYFIAWPRIMKIGQFDVLFVVTRSKMMKHRVVNNVILHYILLPITRRQILDSSKLKEFADDNFKLDENGRKLSKWVENTVGKGEIARYEQFLLFPQCFSKG